MARSLLISDSGVFSNGLFSLDGNNFAYGSFFKGKMSCTANLYILFTNIKNIQYSEVRKNMECKAAKVDHVTVQIMINMNIKIEAQPTVILGMDTNKKKLFTPFLYLEFTEI